MVGPTDLDAPLHLIAPSTSIGVSNHSEIVSCHADSSELSLEVWLVLHVSIIVGVSMWVDNLLYMTVGV